VAKKLHEKTGEGQKGRDRSIEWVIMGSHTHFTRIVQSGKDVRRSSVSKTGKEPGENKLHPYPCWGPVNFGRSYWREGKKKTRQKEEIFPTQEGGSRGFGALKTERAKGHAIIGGGEWNQNFSQG